MSTKALAKPAATFPSLVDDFFKPLNEWFGNSALSYRTLTMPSVNISEDEAAYKVELAAPGLSKEDFKINVEGNLVTISSEKEEQKQNEDAHYTRREYSYTSFSRSFSLPDNVKQENIDASYANGVLTVHLPKKEESRKAPEGKQIAVK